MYKTFYKWFIAKWNLIMRLRLLKRKIKLANPVLFDRLHQSNQFLVRIAYNDVMMSRAGPNEREEVELIMRNVGLVALLEDLKEFNERRPIETFEVLAQIYARLLNKDEFGKFFNGSLGFPKGFEDEYVFRDFKKNLKFKEERN